MTNDPRNVVAPVAPDSNFPLAPVHPAREGESMTETKWADIHPRSDPKSRCQVPIIADPLETWQRYANRDGYGAKIPTTWKVQFRGRWRRIYCRIFSNSGVCYLTVKGTEWILDEYSIGAD